MNTSEIMRLADEMAGFKETPEDSQVYVPAEHAKKVLFGIDVGSAELMLAKEQGYDLVITHHPAGGNARLYGWKVFKRHVDQMVEAGIARQEAEKIVRIKEARLGVESHPANYDQVPSVARMIGMPFMNIHNSLDEVGRQRIMKVLGHLKNPQSAAVSDVVNLFKEEIHEFKKALTEIEIRLGAAENKAGKIVISHAAYTNGGYEIARSYFDHGVKTLAYIHIAESDLTRLRQEAHGNLLILGHIVSDSIGINPFIKELEERGVSVTRFGGVLEP